MRVQRPRVDGVPRLAGWLEPELLLLHCCLLYPVRGAGTRELSRCNDDIRMLQLEVAELQRKLFATQASHWTF